MKSGSLNQEAGLIQTTILYEKMATGKLSFYRIVLWLKPHVAETVFRSPQLTLFDLGPDEWLLYWKAPAYAPRRRHAPLSNITQLVLFEMPVLEKAAGANEPGLVFSPRKNLRLVKRPSETERP